MALEQFLPTVKLSAVTRLKRLQDDKIISRSDISTFINSDALELQFYRMNTVGEMLFRSTGFEGSR